MTARTTSARHVRAAAVLAVLILLSSTGCQARAGTAALVGPGRISEDQVRGVAQEGLSLRAVRQVVGADVGGYRRLILARLLKHDLIAGAARRLGVSASEGRIDQTIAANLQQLNGRPQLLAALAGNPYRLPPSQLRPFFRDIVLVDAIAARLVARRPVTDAEARQFYAANGGPQSGQTFAQLRSQIFDALRLRLAQQYVDQYLRSQKITVNPRYGRFDPTKLFNRNDAPSIVATRDDLVRDS